MYFETIDKKKLRFLIISKAITPWRSMCSFLLCYKFKSKPVVLIRIMRRFRRSWRLIAHIITRKLLSQTIGTKFHIVFNLSNFVHQSLNQGWWGWSWIREFRHFFKNFGNRYSTVFYILKNISHTTNHFLFFTFKITLKIN